MYALDIHTILNWVRVRPPLSKAISIPTSPYTYLPIAPSSFTFTTQNQLSSSSCATRVQVLL